MLTGVFVGWGHQAEKKRRDLLLLQNVISR